MQKESPERPRLPRLALGLECSLTAALMLAGLLALPREGSLGFTDAPSSLRTLAWILAAAALASTLASLARIARSHKYRELPARSALTLLATAQAIAFLCVLFGSRHNGLARFYLHIGGVALAGHIALLAPQRLERALRWLNRFRSYRILELICFQLIVILTASELALRGVNLARGENFIPDFNNPFRNKLTSPQFGHEPNALGYNDRAFERRPARGRVRVAAIGDSFFVGHVPRPLSVIARTEEELRALDAPVELYNFGIVAIDIAGYRRVLEEALNFEPDLILLGIYIGNDIRAQTPEASLFNRRYFALYHNFKLITQAWEARRLQREGEFVDLTRQPAHQRDWATAPPPVVASRARYLDIARRRLPFFLEPQPASVARAWRDSLASLDAIIARCREVQVPLVVVLEPDHIQLADDTYQELCRSRGLDPKNLDRARPQRRLTAFLNERDVPCIDLLPELEKAADELGGDALYLGNDTHWSVAGNDRAARSLARALAPRIRSLSPKTAAR